MGCQAHTGKKSSFLKQIRKTHIIYWTASIKLTSQNELELEQNILPQFKNKWLILASNHGSLEEVAPISLFSVWSLDFKHKANGVQIWSRTCATAFDEELQPKLTIFQY